MLGRTDSRLRLVVLLGVFVAIAALLGTRLAYWQLGEGPELRRAAEADSVRPAVSEVRRGDIVDRSGNILATTAYRDLLAAYPDQMLDAQRRAEICDRLAQILGYDSDRTAALLASLTNSEGNPVPYLIVERQLTSEQSDAVRAGLASHDLIGLGLEAHPVRIYPSAGGSPGTTLASQLLGFVSQDGQGRYGVEQESQDVLAGAGSATADAGDAPLPQAGGDVQLTIDASLQLRLEKELYAAWVADRAQRVTGLVMNPYTGEIMAWGSVPGYDANAYSDVAQRSPGLFVDPVVSQVYEPGSVMKMFTAAAALEEGVVGLETPVKDQKKLVFGESTVMNFDKKSMGTVAFEDAIAHSRNVATGKVALMLGDTTDAASAVLYDMWQRLGIGQTTGVEVPNESAGLVTDPALTRWHPIDLVNRAFGQAVAVTPIQLAAAFAAMANGGTLVHPHLYTADDAAAEADLAQAISPELSDTLRQLMVHVVDEGPHYAEETKIDGYVVGGKTGTAQIWDTRTGAWLPNIYNHTFVGFVGAERPEAIILVRIHDTEPRVPKRWGMSLEMTSNELFRRIALDAISVLDLQPLPGYEQPGTTDQQSPDAGAEPGSQASPAPNPDASPPAAPGQPAAEQRRPATKAGR